MSSIIFKPRILETTTTTGYGAIALGGAVTGYQTFSVIGNGNYVYYAIWAVNSNGIPTGDWEEGLGTYTSSSNTVSRSIILGSSNSNNSVNFGAGRKYIGNTFPSVKAAFPKIEIFPAGTDISWTAPTGATCHRIILIGGGGGGGSGRKGASGTQRNGGTGGSAGGFIDYTFQTPLINESLITVGYAGVGGAAQTTNSTNGNPGTDGGYAEFTTLKLKAYGGTGGYGGTSTGSGNGTPPTGGQGEFIGGTSGGGWGGSGQPGQPGQPGTGLAPPGGGGGGGIGTGNSASNGGDGSIPNFARLTPAAGGVATGGNGNDGDGSLSGLGYNLYIGGSGAGGAGGLNTGSGNGGSGGDGADYGAGGGGGGGATNNIGNSGAGGNGGSPVVIIITW